MLSYYFLRINKDYLLTYFFNPKNAYTVSIDSGVPHSALNVFRASIEFTYRTSYYDCHPIFPHFSFPTTIPQIYGSHPPSLSKTSPGNT